MKSPFFLFIIILATAFAGCESTPKKTEVNEVKQEVPASGKLQTRLGTAADKFTSDSALVSFTVINGADSVQRFVKWETPFEPFIGKFMEVVDAGGNEAEFRGAMARRIMPPPADSYIEVPAHDSVKTTYNIARNYSLKNGEYKVKYSGSGVSGLDSGNEIRIIVTNP